MSHGITRGRPQKGCRAWLLLINAGVTFARSIAAGAIGGSIVGLREHVLVPEPFVLVAMIAAVRRILVLTAEFGKLR